MRAAGEFTLDQQGARYRVAEPELLDAAAAFTLLDRAHRRGWRLFGITHFLQVRQRACGHGAPGAFV